MQDEVNEKTIALYIKTGKLTAQTLQKAMKAILSKGKKQLAKPPQGKQSLKQLMKQNAGVSNIEITLPCGSYPFVNLREANTLLRKLFTSRKSEKNVRQHSGTQKGAIEAITSIHTGYMIRAPTFRRSTQRQEPHPLQLNTAAPQNLRSAGTAAFTRGRFFCAAATIR